MNLKIILWYFKYNRNTGKLFWRNHQNKATIKQFYGLEAGTKHIKGYKVIRLNDKNYYVHRLIYLIEYNKSPQFIDHIDGDRLNNKIKNLRSATKRINGQNFNRHRVGRLVGASFEKSRGLWSSQIHIKGKKIFLGRYETELQAHRAYKNKIKEGLGIYEE